MRNNKSKNLESSQIDFEWQAKYIWIENDLVEAEENNPNSNTWVYFRKNFIINSEKDIDEVVCKIAVDSKYWLYINGEIVIRDGELKRGEKENSIYYDEINIEDYLKKGENNISILVWYFGKDGFSHVDSGQGALLFQTQIGDNIIISDNTWKAQKSFAYLKDDENTNGRLSESNIYYDSNLELENWNSIEYDDSSWDDACIYGDYNDEKWGELIKRDIPFFVFSDIKVYDNFSEYENKTFDEDKVLEMEVSYNMQLVPYLKVKAQNGQKIIISNNKDFDNSEYYGKVTYIAKDGVQEYESPSWINGDKIYYYIPKGVEVISLGYRSTGYDTEMSGNFECNDNELNILWQMANRTLYLNMRDTYMDCPDRERAMWIGDTSIDMEEAMYGLDTSSYKLYEKCIKEFIGWKSSDVLNTVSPSVNSALQLPTQNLLAICSMYNYYEYTGNKDFLVCVYPSIKDYMNLWSVGDDGLVAGRGNYYLNIMQWYDSQGKTDTNILENVWYYYALENLCKIAKELDLVEDYKNYELRLSEMNKAFNEKFWNGIGYKSENYEGYDARANSIAVLSGIADESKYESISNIIADNYDNSVFMEKYILEALCQIGNIEIVQNRIKIRYSDMVENQDYSTTLWEYWDKEVGTKNHAWGGGPLIIMSKYFAGIQLLKPGYSEILIKPEFGILNKLSANVNTIQGTINLDASKDSNELILKINVPQKTLIVIEKMSDDYNIKINNKEVCKNGKWIDNKISTLYKEDEKSLYVYVEKGEYNIISK